MLGFAPIGASPIGGLRFTSASSGYTLTAAPGSYSITGTAAAPKYARIFHVYDELILNGRFSLDTSGWAVDGADTTFTAVSGEGVLALGPTAADGFAYAAITVVPGQLYTLTGKLKSSGYLFTTDPGAFTVTGSAADLIYDSNILALEDLTLTDVGVGPQHVGYKLKPSGAIVETYSDRRFREDWLPRGADGKDYEVRATHLSGDTPTGTFGTWLQLDTSREWDLREDVVGTLSGSMFVEIRLIGTTTTGASATITMTATRTA